jgi:hypothetical protein
VWECGPATLSSPLTKLLLGLVCLLYRVPFVVQDTAWVGQAWETGVREEVVAEAVVEEVEEEEVGPPFLCPALPRSYAAPPLA